MRTAAIGAIVASLLAACSGASGLSQLPAGPVTLSIVGTNDVHGAILPGGPERGGLASFGGYLANLRAVRAQDGGVLLIDAGDMWQGTMESNLSEGRTVVEIYNQLGYSAAAIGNHELDFGPAGPAATPVAPGDDPQGALKARAADARFPLLSANLLDRSTGRPVDWPNVRPSMTTDVAGVTVGIIGLTTAAALDATIRANTAGLALAPLAETAAAEATRLRASGADVVVVTAHAGGSCRQFVDPQDLTSCEPASEIARVAAALPAGLVDVIVAGHTHAGVSHEINGIAVIESFSRGRAFGRVDLVVDPAAGHVVSRVIHRPQDICRLAEPGSTQCARPGTRAPAASYEGAPVVADRAVEALADRAVTAVTALKNERLGVELSAPVRVSGAIESPLGNLFVDAMLAVAPGADLALNNTVGGLRADLPAGLMTYGHLYEVFPFDNELVTLRLTGADLKRLFATVVTRGSRLVGVAGARVLAGCRGRTAEVRLVRPSGAEIADDEEIVVATTDYLATGPLFEPVRPERRQVRPGPVLRDLLADWFRQRGGVIDPRTLIDETRPRFPPASGLPLACQAG